MYRTVNRLNKIDLYQQKKKCMFYGQKTRVRIYKTCFLFGDFSLVLNAVSGRSADSETDIYKQQAPPQKV